jgi:hypothetical protein
MKIKDVEQVLDSFYDMEICREKISTLWSLGHYDGVAVGLVRYQDKIYLADTLLGNHVHPRIFFLIEMDQEKVNEIISWLEKRYKIAGNMKYHPNGERDSLDIGHGTETFRDEIEKFRREYIRPDYSPDEESRIIGWFRGW